ncbi:hypothetical protein MOQ72_42320 [Saccharopolyspora sp. K220]|uniref:hypothetical protein n=1 Tax=Saccharopolyspora soli TaxID=2926618 RepID=UPI001F579570|nr:hypothetical protein [Saccharopolyspora soli]MCI2424054.1 hypothetical protein [Saccharopolyspora soli]
MTATLSEVENPELEHASVKESGFPLLNRLNQLAGLLCDEHTPRSEFLQLVRPTVRRPA